MSMFGADDRLSRAASVVWRSNEKLDQELSLDGSGELGDRIVSGFNRWLNEQLAELGFTAESYNQALRDRLVGDGPMSYRAWSFLGVLEVESVEEHFLNHTFVETCGEQSSLSYLGLTVEDVEVVDGKPHVKQKR